MLCTDEPASALGLRALLEGTSEAEPLGLCSIESEIGRILPAARRVRPQVMVYALSLDPHLTRLATLRRALPYTHFVLWGRDFQAKMAQQALQLGVRGFLCTTAPPEVAREGLRAVAAGGTWMDQDLASKVLSAPAVHLSGRQLELLEHLVKGLKNREIAHAMGITEGTVKAYLTAIFEKVGTRNRFELALFGLEHLPSALSRDSQPPRRTAYPVRMRSRPAEGAA